MLLLCSIRIIHQKNISKKVQLLIYQSIYIPTLTCAHEKWVTTEKLVVEIQFQGGTTKSVWGEGHLE